ncbi:MAG: translation elongation factor Ts, partial [Pontixanthobacter sp.]
MAAISVADVKTLREKTGAGMMDAKKALTEAGGDIEAAVDALRAKGLASAQKKSSRTAAEGLVGVAVEGTKGVAVEVNSETDFVAKNDKFQEFVRNTTKAALVADADDIDALKAAEYPGGGTVGEKLTDNVATIGENQQVRRMKTVSVAKGLVVPYMHNAAADNLGKIGVLVALES